MATAQGFPDGHCAAVMVPFGRALGVQSPRYIHGPYPVILPNVHHFVDKMRIGEWSPGIYAVKTDVSQVVMAAPDTRRFVYPDFMIGNTVSKYFPRQR